ncbi:guanylate kinase [Aphanothece hegewaldii CCALA 016]|uniref:Guanylate kinase n=1 Tax=Aphanothece hegewaldii CCALA 016 TaxID=2107694 RepID=A0A2T1M1P4_9CHRO|nr:guanylate kinase [Aphanothece hegewaldii]PSF38621.1 guanylate kinase [Aphanothece hegewaldii CCALA 016]
MMSGQLIVITGPSGVGKGTLVHKLLERYPNLHLSVSATTRLPRAGEIDGKDYYFVSKEVFGQMIQEEKLLEWAEFAGNCYGTPRIAVEEKLQQNISVLLEIEIEGAKQIKQTFPKAFRIFILPPSFDELDHRLRQRGTETETAILRRLERAKEEIALKEEFDRQIINDDLETALTALIKEIESII